MSDQPGDAAPLPQDDLPEQMRVRREKLDRLRGKGVDPYPLGFPRTTTIAELRSAYFSAGIPSEVTPDLRSMVTFAQHDLLREEPPEKNLQLIVCRNVIIYFDRESQERLFERFVDALAPGGYLVLGKVETLLGSARTALASVDPRARIFRRP